MAIEETVMESIEESQKNIIEENTREKKQKSYIVTFVDEKKGTKVKKKVLEGECVTEIDVKYEELEVNGETIVFAHWGTRKDDSASEYDFSLPVKSNITLYAIYANIVPPDEGDFGKNNRDNYFEKKDTEMKSPKTGQGNSQVIMTLIFVLMGMVAYGAFKKCKSETM